MTYNTYMHNVYMYDIVCRVYVYIYIYTCVYQLITGVSGNLTIKELREIIFVTFEHQLLGFVDSQAGTGFFTSIFRPEGVHKWRVPQNGSFSTENPIVRTG